MFDYFYEDTLLRKKNIHQFVLSLQLLLPLENYKYYKCTFLGYCKPKLLFMNIETKKKNKCNQISLKKKKDKQCPTTTFHKQIQEKKEKIVPPLFF